MRILLDYISLQGYINGGALYVFRVYERLFKEHSDVEYFGLYDSRMDFCMHIDTSSIQMIDIENNEIPEVINKNAIDLFYIGIGQRFNKFKLEGIDCRTICTIHDVGNIEYFSNRYDAMLNGDFKSRCLNALNILSGQASRKIRLKVEYYKYYNNIIKFVEKSNVEVVTVSRHTVDSIKYFFPELKSKEMKVFYPPFDRGNNEGFTDVPILENKKFLLLLNISRANKNANTIIQAMKRIVVEYPEYYLATTGGETFGKNIINLHSVSTAQLSWLYNNAIALVYPSVTEGFGYPPLEAMKYGTPVFCANISPLSEIYANSVIMFSPFSPNEFYSKFKRFVSGDYKQNMESSHKHYFDISKHADDDMNNLIKYILGEGK